MTDDSTESRRQVLRAVGIGTTVALAGCSGSGGGDDDTNTTSDDTETEQSSTETEERSTETSSTDDKDTTTQTQSRTSTGNGEYPKQESEGLQAWMNEQISGEENLVALKFNLDNLEVSEFPNILERYNEGRQGQNVYEDLGELADGPAKISFDEMLYVAANLDYPASEAETMYFIIQKPEIDGKMNAIVNTNEASRRDYSSGKQFAAGWPDNSDAVIDEQKEFFMNIEAEYEELIHTVDLGDAPYIEEALR